MESLIVFIVSFVFVFVTYFIIYLIKYKKGTIKETKEVKFLCYKYGVKIKNMNFKRLWGVFALLNALIISVSGTACTSLKIGYVWQVLTGFGLLFIMIFLVYGALGKILIKKRRKVIKMINTRVIEKKWQKRWEEEGAFTAKNNSDKKSIIFWLSFHIHQELGFM